jgi:hypothetical protein
VIDEYGANGGMIFAGETEVLGENLPSATLSTTNPTWIDPGTNPGLRGERPATNRLSLHLFIRFKHNNALQMAPQLEVGKCENG